MSLSSRASAVTRAASSAYDQVKSLKVSAGASGVCPTWASKASSASGPVGRSSAAETSAPPRLNVPIARSGSAIAAARSASNRSANASTVDAR